MSSHAALQSLTSPHCAGAEILACILVFSTRTHTDITTPLHKENLVDPLESAKFFAVCSAYQGLRSWDIYRS